MSDSQKHQNNLPTWKILIADDDEDVRMITQVVLKSVVFEGIPLQCLFAGSSEETLEQMRQHPDIGVLLLDMIMDRPDAGFFVAQKIRQELDNHAVRIILRTGRTSDEFSQADFLAHDINDIREKTLSAKQLIFAVVGALRSYKDIRFSKNRSDQRIKAMLS